MIAFLLLNWRWLAPAVAILALCGMLAVTKIQLTSLRGEIAVERLAAADLALKAAKDAAAKDAANAELSRNLDADHAKAVADIAASHDDFARQLAERVRAARARCANSVPVAAAGAGESAAVAPGGSGGPGQPDLESGNRLREVGRRLQEDVKECVAWANKVGR